MLAAFLLEIFVATLWDLQGNEFEEGDSPLTAGRITLADLAGQLDLSTATVSRALREDSVVNAETRERVHALATELGYLPRRAARPTSSPSAPMRKGFALVQPLNSFAFEDPLLLDFVGGMASRTLDFGRLFHLIPTDVSQEERCYDSVLDLDYLDGFVLLNARPSSDWRIEHLQARGVPFVVHGHGSEDAVYPCLDVGFRYGHRLATDHLIGLGHRSIALLNALPGTLAAAEWEAGYREGMEAAGLPIRANWVLHGPKTEEFGYRATRQLLQSEPTPTAAIYSNVLSAKGALQALNDAGVAIGSEFSLIAYDDQLPGAFYSVPITTIFAPCRPMGARLVELLEGAASGEPYDLLQDRSEPELVIRASTATNG